MSTLKKFLISLISVSLLSCSNITNNDTQIISEESSYEDLEALSTQKAGVDRLLCVSLPTGGDSEIVKVQDLKTKEQRGTHKESVLALRQRFQFQQSVFVASHCARFVRLRQ